MVKFKDNAFWSREDKTQVTAIRLEQIGPNQEKTDQVKYDKFLGDGKVNPDWQSVVNAVGEGIIDNNTQERVARKEREKEERRIQNEQRQKSKDMEALFAQKMRAFEVEEIKNSEQKDILKRMRQSKSLFELNSTANLLMTLETGVLKTVLKELLSEIEAESKPAPKKRKTRTKAKAKKDD